jgi:hypothetical protein
LHTAFIDRVVDPYIAFDGRITGAERKLATDDVKLATDERSTAYASTTPFSIIACSCTL